ncbi:hypothetical protein GUITHDRAFT_103059 [Guillardia theta CCMP2712]|uniref:HTH CENPB-type domain-containing protein n=1 Tax=Guillardia theta (strain CCMP2712) TaxID=905079 RepID=L1JSS7_GUITC|nr:hypothetical protein GUITHDRAFT_103059 [Guillardia theta CCMP2712]EKX51138.1 hypothetical protein GUITHDRAFT_103059 [Guillardia theta CCMP2712]|eukprot:XP_005838118.1 hypothetical protein GUITHDRAFT_103059 [Guillardia theta CCMP2712]
MLSAPAVLPISSHTSDQAPRQHCLSSTSDQDDYIAQAQARMQQWGIAPMPLAECCFVYLHQDPDRPDEPDAATHDHAAGTAAVHDHSWCIPEDTFRGMDDAVDIFFRALPAASIQEESVASALEAPAQATKMRAGKPDPSPAPPWTSSGPLQKSSRWSDARKAQHSLTCRSKTKLSIAQKLAIIHDYQVNSTPQSVLAARFGKSKSAISKILRPDNVARLRSIQSVGVKATQSSCARSHNLELERRLHEYVEMSQQDGQWRQLIRTKAKELAGELGLSGFRATKGWCNRFIQRHGFETAMTGACAGSSEYF